MIQESKNYEVLEKEYTEVLNHRKILADEMKPWLMAINAEEIRIGAKGSIWENHSQYIILVLAFEHYKKAVLFHDSDVLKKLDELKFPKRMKRWFVSIDDIQKEFDFISKRNIKIDKSYAFFYIKSYLIEKYRFDMQMKYLSVTNDNIEMPQLTKDLMGLQKRRMYSNGNPKTYKNAYEILLNETINQFDKLPLEKLVPQSKSNLDFLIKLSKGTSEFFLKKLLEECFEYDHKTIDKTHFYGIVYGLFALVMQDRSFITEEDFDNIPRYRTSSYKSFLSYKHHKLNKIFNSKSKK